ncbi:undecaprenyl diphosphate synthase [Proteiniborus ethanoligenes]|uniref:Isoprenyl transferase n=1 Tax=Proteiniborus ethanoligenes TaxID=415015 RepID=A0A1H3N701_9FIRM|nr:isoprenyl transferase [Proteiniborus ethanoligenes]SDY84245.1 undecaprenyl diphosphate synthase [Proteiniborus ethanoligenes]
MSMNSKNINSLYDSIDKDRLPKHVAIIMDGNGRWAKNRFLPRTAGHREGVERVKEIVEVSGNLGIEFLTLFAFSTENWTRPKEEINVLMKLLVEYLRKELNTLHDNNVKINILGNLEKLPQLPREEVYYAINKTRNNNKMVLNIALNYGGRSEIIKAIQSLIKDVQDAHVAIEDIDENIFSNYLFTSNQPDPDLLIRPSGEKRISNFLLYQIAYTEFVFTDVYWPEFTKEEFYKSIIEFQSRKRRFGGV